MSAQAGWVVKAFQNSFHQLLHCSSAGDAIINTTSLGADTDKIQQLPEHCAERSLAAIRFLFSGVKWF